MTAHGSWPVLAAFLVLAAEARAVEYPAPSGELGQAIRSAAQSAVDSRNAGASINESAARVTQGWNRILGLTLLHGRLDAAARTAANMAETARTDKQIGPGSSVSGTTTLAEKANVPALLALALEHGAIQQEEAGTSVTLRSSPYSLVAFVEGDTPGTFERWRWARRLTAAGVFAVDPEKSTGAGGFELDKFQQLSVRWNAIGDRSPRSSEFTKLWIEKVKELDQQQVDEAADAYTAFLNQPNLAQVDETLLERRDASARRAIEEVTRLLPRADRAGLEAALWSVLCTEILQAQDHGELRVSDEALAALAESLARQQKLRTRADTAMKEALREFDSRLAVALGWDLNRVNDASDYSDVKLIADGVFGIVDGSFTRQPDPNAAIRLVANLSLSLNHSSASAPSRETVRDYSGTISVEKSVGNILTGRFVNDRDLSRINVALSGQLKYLEAVNDPLFAGVLKFDLPLASGLSIPLSFSYSSRTETRDRDEFRVNAGAVLDSDKLSALGRLLNL